MNIAALDLPKTARLVNHADAPEEGLDVADIASAVKSLAGSLPSLKRSAVVVQAPNNVGTIFKILAVAEAGGVPAPLSPELDTETVNNCAHYLGAAGYWGSGSKPEITGSGRALPRGFDLVMHSSGSTGTPKPLAIRLDAIRRNAFDVAALLNLGSDDRHLGTMSHCYMSGLYNATLLPLLTGATSISLEAISPLNVRLMSRALRAHRPTVVWLNPLLARTLVRLRSFAAGLFDGVRFVVACTAPLAQDTKEAFEQKFGCPLLQSYGLCETLITTVERPDDPAPGTVGRPVGERRPLWLGDGGEVVVANGALFAGTLDPWPDRDDLAPPAYYHTGDMGSFDGGGNLIIEGRVAEVINRNGVKFAPETVEQRLSGLVSVEDCAIVGVPDPKLDTRLVAFIVSSARDTAEITQAMRTSLPPLQRPHDIVWVPVIPRTANGKIDRAALRQMERP